MSEDYINNYNPFEDPGAEQTTQNQTSQPSSSPATSAYSQPLNPTQPNATPVTPTAQITNLSNQFFGLNDADLSAREAELARREMELARQEALVANGIPVESAGYTNRPKNFPPLIKIWKYYPDDELPEESRPLVKQIFILWLVISGTYFFNWISSFICLGAADSLSSVGSLVVLATIYLFCFVPISYEVSFFVLYKSLRDKSGLTFFCFLFSFAIWGIVIFWHAIGMDEGGSLGWIQTIDLFSGGHGFAGFLGLLISVGLTTSVVGICFFWRKCYKYYKENGLQTSAFGEASTIAAKYARENPDVVTNLTSDVPTV